uniref:Uncharacterized protein n=1 Tax=Picea sitchensis TaxID=3332 RepID=B8LN46_PICSI|nr:unknown [Picea sitchensis]
MWQMELQIRLLNSLIMLYLLLRLSKIVCGHKKTPEVEIT